MQIVRTSHRPEAGAMSAVSAGGDDWAVALGPADVLARQKRCVVAAGGLELLVIFHRKRFTVVENRCPHLGARLADARVSRRSLTCPLHSHRYSLDDGTFMSAPGYVADRNRRLNLFSTQVVDGCLYAVIDQRAAGRVRTAMTQEPRSDTRRHFGATDTDVAVSPRPVYQEVRNAALAPGVAVVVSTRCEVEQVLRQPENYSSAGRLLLLQSTRPLPPVELDPPAHAAWRAALDPLFAPSRVGELATIITGLASRLINDFAGEPEIDFATRFSVPLPAQVLMTLLGLPLDDLPWFLDLKDGVIHPNRVLGKPLDDPEVIAYQTTMTAEVYDYFGAALDRREAEGAGDLLSQLLDLEIDGEPVSRDSLLALCFGLLVEGIDPMSAALDCAFACLAEHPEYREEVMATPRQALEELLRWETPVTFVTRTAVTDTVIGECPVSAGQRVLALLSAANVDPVESPDAGVLQWNRKVNRHLAFGTGIHRCLGSHLARLQLAIALREWHSRIPHYSVERPEELAFAPGVRTVDRFPMRLGRQL